MPLRDLFYRSVFRCFGMIFMQSSGLAAQGKIGKVASTHLSYAGNQFDLSAVRMDSGPAGAKLLKDEGVDVVLLTPV